MNTMRMLDRRVRSLDQARVLRIGFIVLCLSVLVDLGLYLLSHRSTSIIVLAGLAAAFALAGIAVTVLVSRWTQERITRLRARAERWRDVYLAITLVILFGFGLGMRAEWVYVHIAAMLCAGLILGYLLLYADAPPLSRVWIIVLVVGFVAVTLLRVNGLTDYPSRFIDDEPWDLAWAMSYLQRGYFTDPIMYYGGFDIQRFMLPVAWWISIFGTGYWQIRLFFFLLIFPLVGLTGLAAHNFYNNGRITALVMLCSAVVMGAARIRHDVGLALAVAASLWLYSEALKRNQRTLHFAAGLAIGLGWFAHYHATGFGVALAIAFYLPSTIERWRQGKRLPEAGAWLFMLGGLIGAGIVVLFQILPDWAGFVAARALRNPRSLADLVTTFFGHWGTIAAQSQFEFLLILLAIAAAIWRHQRNDVMLVLLVLLMHVALALLATLTLAYYLVPMIPVYALLIASLLTEGIGVRLKRSLVWVVASLVMVVNLGFTLQSPLVHLRTGAPLQLALPAAIAWIKANVAPTEKIVAEHWYYLFLTDYKFISAATQRYAPAAIKAETAESMWDQIAPDVIVIDPNLSTCCTRPIQSPDYLASRGYKQVAEFDDQKYPVLIYEKSGG